ncbi:LamG-like jellyroll fold domain-containing protein [Roseibium sp.]|uniref:LamG-like jellyroll fold domain-containing protein n=1 Tax=Roseibium sp. TaxID=1936156 RepID=UPI003D0988AD
MQSTGNTLSRSAIYSIEGLTSFSGEKGDYLQAAHTPALSLSNGTVALTFNADDVEASRTLFSKDGKGYDAGGHLTVYLRKGALIVRQQSDTESEYLKVKDVTIAAGQTYHLAVSFGADGLNVYLNGQLAASEPDFQQGLELNTRAFVVGASGAWRSDDGQRASSQFDGTISDVMVFDSQLGQMDVAALAGVVDASFESAALKAMVQQDLLPAFQQLHHGSDEAKALAMAYGISHDGALTTGVAVQTGTDGADTLTGTGEADAIDGGLGNDTIDGAAGNDVLQGGYGNDDLNGGEGNDVLDGGHGEDVLNGGAGDDLLISQSDGREGAIAYIEGRDEGDPENELINGKVYPNQPIPADDILTGGLGADTFYFQTLINAKQRYIEKHTQNDGTIRWHGVAGENDKLHDHWVDIIGHDVIMDFNRGEGDRILIEGHTTKIRSISYGDANSDGVMDHSVIRLYSDQGRGGGAHNQDDLGTITVYGDLVKLTDISTTSKPAYGIVTSIADLSEAIQPIQIAEDREPYTPPTNLPGVGDLPLPSGLTPVFAFEGSTSFSGERGDYLQAAHTPALSLSNGTVALTFNADDVEASRTLFSKDGKGYDAGGHLTVYLRKGALIVRQQSDTESEYLKVKDVTIAAGQTYHLAVSFGADGLNVYLNGQLAASEPDFQQGLELNTRAFVVGASGAWRSDDGQRASSQFDGTISDVMVFDSQLGQMDVAALAGVVDASFESAALKAMVQQDLLPAFQQLHHGSDEAKALAMAYGISHDGALTTGAAMQTGTDGADALTGSGEADAIDGGLGNDTIDGAAGNDVLQGGYGNDDLNGGEGNDVLDGGHGEDVLNGGAGDDLLISQSDGREGAIAYIEGRDEGDPENELINGKVYPNQPIPSDDILTGGLGADTFYFQTLINAKQRYIEKHTQNDGTIRWHGVAGENDKLHDHWVDIIGHDVITDFNRGEGDRILIEGHTTKIRSISYGDANSDGVMDHSVIRLYSDQGRGGGAHNQDDLGTITVFGDLVKLTDISTTSKPAYGIVTSIADLSEAIQPIQIAEDREPYTPPTNLPGGISVTPPPGASVVVVVPGAMNFDNVRNDQFAIEHQEKMAVSEGTIAFTFKADAITSHDALFSKDAKGNGDGGHVTAFVTESGTLKVRFQTAEDETWLYAKNSIVAGQEYDFAATFGDDGVYLYLNGAVVASDAEFRTSLAGNKEYLILGGNGWGSEAGEIGWIGNRFDGTIKDFTLLDQQLDEAQIKPLFSDSVLV